MPSKGSSPKWAQKWGVMAVYTDVGFEELEGLLADPSLYAERGSDVARLQASLASARNEVTRLVSRWEALEAKKGT